MEQLSQLLHGRLVYPPNISLDNFAAQFTEVLGRYAGANHDRLRAATSHLFSEEVVQSFRPAQLALGDGTLDGLRVTTDPNKLPLALMNFVDESMGQEGVGRELAEGLANDPNGPRVGLAEIVNWLGTEVDVYPLADAGPDVLPLLLVFTQPCLPEIENFLQKELLDKELNGLKPVALGRSWLYFTKVDPNKTFDDRLVIATTDDVVMFGPLLYVQRALNLDRYVPDAARRLILNEVRRSAATSPDSALNRWIEQNDDLLEAFLRPEFIESSQIREDGFVLHMKQDLLIDAAGRFDDLRTAREVPVSEFQSARQKGTGEFVSIARSLGGELRIISLQNQSTLNSPPLLFTLSVTDSK